ncbi:sensor histidine kinase [Microbispora corallina]|nr:sensor histidine kinase [Microbispora corallina]
MTERPPPLADPFAERGRVRRSMRDWAVDTLLFLLAAVVTLLLSMLVWTDPALSPPMAMLDQVLGGLACAALWLRRRWPVGLALALAALSTFSMLVAAAGLVAVFTVVVHRRFPIAAPVVGLHLLAILPYTLLRPDPDLSFWASVLVSVLVYALVVAWGLFVRARRQLVLSLRERVRRAEVEAALREERARGAERERIAREMHDVLAHRISLLSLYAGGLEFRPDAPAADISRAAGAIRSSAHQALEDLREVIGVLRGGPEDAVPERPQPTLTDVPELVAECRRAGMEIELAMPEPAAEPPGGLGRNAYRIIQEGLTNARKHAPGSAVRVTVSGGPGEGLVVDVANAGPARPVAAGARAATKGVRHTATAVPRGGAAPAPGLGDGGALPGGVSPAPGRSAAARGSAVAVPDAAPPVVAVPAAAGLPGSGTGLIGLAERASLTGGRLDHGPADGGGFRLRAWLPWPA